VFLPRVQSGRSILHCAQWRLDSAGEEIPVPNGKAFAEWFAGWRERWLVPRHVYLSWADNRLLYDLDDASQVEDLRSELRHARGQGQCLLQEALPGPEHAWLPSADGGRHIVELVVSLGLRDDAPKPSAGRPERRGPSWFTPDLRLRPPGSDWLYLKLYGPRSGEDEMIAGAVRGLCRDIQGRVGEEWFFLRYADPDPHLRLRFRVAPMQLTQLFPRLCAWASKLVADGTCQKFSFDTYEREVERYGGPEATDTAEALFGADSRAVADLLACPAQADRMTLAVITNDLLRSLGLDDSARLAWLKQTVTSRKEVSDEYRTRRDRLLSALRDPARFSTEVEDILARRRAELQRIEARLATLQQEGALTQPLAKLYESYVHMHCNRLWGEQTAERRALGLVLRASEAIAHHPEATPKAREATPTGIAAAEY